MKKRIICLSVICLMLLSTACKKPPKSMQEENAAAEQIQEMQQVNENQNQTPANETYSEPEKEQTPQKQQEPAKEQSAEQPEKAEEKEEELYNFEITEEPFESMTMSEGYASYKTYGSEQALFDRADLVIVGMPIETFTDGEAHCYDAFGNEVDKNDKSALSYYTMRDVKVLEVLKGEDVPETLKLGNTGVVSEAEDGSKIIIGHAQADKITKKNVKYVYYLLKYSKYGVDYYFASLDYGVINIDGLDTRFDKDGVRYDATYARVPELFEKYDRSKELEK